MTTRGVRGGTQAEEVGTREQVVLGMHAEPDGLHEQFRSAVVGFDEGGGHARAVGVGAAIGPERSDGCRDYIRDGAIGLAEREDHIDILVTFDRDRRAAVDLDSRIDGWSRLFEHFAEHRRLYQPLALGLDDLTSPAARGSGPAQCEGPAHR